MKAYHYTTQSKHILGDLYTPVGTYLRIRDNYPQSFLMESSDYHGEENSQSFIGFCPIASIKIGHNKVTYSYPDKEVTEDISSDNTVQTAFNKFIKAFNIEGEEKQHCGLYGFTSFNAVKYFEPINIKDSTAPKNDAGDILYIVFKYLIIFDHYNDQLKIIELCSEGEKNHLKDVQSMLDSKKINTYSFKAVGNYFSTQTDEEHRENIRKGIAHCMRGDVFQMVISRRFIQKYEGDDFNLYRALRSINPSPYLFYFDFGGFRLIGSSPETHCCIKNGIAYIDPIAGTTKRTNNEETDALNANLLLQDPKENAEHTMLVDLARNDLNRNCYDVKIDSYKQLHYYSHVIHLVSRVSGKMDKNKNSIKSFIDTFPAGTLSGAPKVKAMQLISKYEPHNRGAYGGCLGFIGMNGDLNQAIIIRTFVSRNNELWFQAGGGIVAKSNVENELNEVKNKLGALRKAILTAEKI